MLPNPYVILGALVGAIMLCLASFGAGHHYAVLQEDKAIAKAEAQAILDTQAQDKITHDADVAQALAQQKIVTQTKTIIQKVPVYVSKKAVDACVVPIGFIRLHNAAASDGTVPDAAGISNDAPAGIGLDTVAASVAGNYGTYHYVAAQLRALQAWVAAQQALKR